MNLNIKYELWMIMMCYWRFISCNDCITVVGNIDNGGCCACVGVKGIWEISVIPTQFCCESKMALKMSIFKNKAIVQL